MSECKLKDIYVRNRVAEAKRLIEAFKLKVRYVNTKCNPADILSRGADVSSLKLSNWLLDNGEMFAYSQSHENHTLENNSVKVETKSSELEEVSVEVDNKCKVESTKVKLEQINVLEEKVSKIQQLPKSNTRMNKCLTRKSIKTQWSKDPFLERVEHF